MKDCKFCGNKCQKAGRETTGTQRVYCKSCKKYQQVIYRYQGYQSTASSMIARLVCESVSIRGIARILKIATATVIKRILSIARFITKPPIPLNRSAFEVDELRTYIRNKENQFWIAYALCSETRQVIVLQLAKEVNEH